MTGNPARVSVGPPVRNGERSVGQAIETLLAQRDGGFELRLSGNAATDAAHDVNRPRDPSVSRP